MWVILLDIVGTLLVVGGLLGLFAESGSTFAAVLKPLAGPLIVLGVLLMAPLVIHAVKRT